MFIISFLVVRLKEYTWIKEWPWHFFIKIYLSHFILERGRNFARKIDGDRRQRQIAILTHNFFSWPYHAVLRSRPHLAILQLLGRRYSTWGLLLPQRRSQCASWVWLRTYTDSDLHTGISIHHFIAPMISDRPRDCFRLFT